jgi:hypothetical protein
VNLPHEELELELVLSLADSADAAEVPMPLLLELLPVGPELDAPPRFMRSRALIALRSLVMNVCGRRVPDLSIEVPPWSGTAIRDDGRRHTIAQSATISERDIMCGEGRDLAGSVSRFCCMKSSEVALGCSY